MFRRVPLLLVVLAGCATAREESRGNSDANDSVDAAVQVDAPHSMADAGATGSCANAFTGVLATYSFSGATGNQASQPVTSTATGIAAGPITRASGLTPVSGATSINSSNWSLGATLDPAKYYALTLTPPSGCTLSLTGAAIDAKASGTGPAMAAVGTSADSFAATVSISTAAPSTPALSVSNASSVIELRVYGFAATATGGTLRLQNTLTVSGSLQ